MAHRHKKEEEGTDINLNRVITPMLDMAFQMLAFFIMTYHPSALEGQMELTLPAAGTPAAKTQAEQHPTQSDIDLPLPADLTINIHTPQGQNQGAPTDYVVDTPQGSSPPMTSKEQLQAYIIQARKDLKNTTDVTIKADGGLKYNFVVEVMDLCVNPQIGGFTRVGFGLGKPMATP